MTPNRTFVAILWTLLLFVITPCGSISFQEDLYQILGVKRTATTKEIKSAYRRRALDTHPDKNPGVDPEEAAAKFHEVVRAFEVLSDDHSRRLYDRTGRHHENRKMRQQQGQQYYQSNDGRVKFSFQFNTKQRVKKQFKDRLDVREAMSRVMHIVSLTQLETVMLDDNGRAERNLLMCFYTPGVEKVVDDTILFPFPFAALNSHGIWWEDVLQTVKVRFHRGNDLTKKFNIPTGEELTEGGKPIFVYVKRGSTFESFETFVTDKREVFEEWVWRMIEVEVTFKNEHDANVELYWIHGKKATLNANIPPGGTYRVTTRLSHEFMARSALVDTFQDADPEHRRTFTDAQKLGSWKILSDEPNQVISIVSKCHDLSGNCQKWKTRGECDRNPGFMHDKCQKTCDKCPLNNPQVNGTLHDEL